LEADLPNTLITIDEAARGILKLIDDNAKKLPKSERKEFKLMCLNYIGGAMFQGPKGG